MRLSDFFSSNYRRDMRLLLLEQAIHNRSLYETGRELRDLAHHHANDKYTINAVEQLLAKAEKNEVQGSGLIHHLYVTLADCWPSSIKLSHQAVDYYTEYLSQNLEELDTAKARDFFKQEIKQNAGNHLILGKAVAVAATYIPAIEKEFGVVVAAGFTAGLAMKAEGWTCLEKRLIESWREKMARIDDRGVKNRQMALIAEIAPEGALIRIAVKDLRNSRNAQVQDGPDISQPS